MNGSVTYEGLILQGGINVDTGANLEELTVYENGVYNPSEGKDGFSKVTVDVPAAVLDDITITENGHYTPPIGVDGYDDITVSVPHPAPVLDDITITENGSYQPPSGIDGYDNITVNVPAPAPVLDDITITQNGTYTPPTGTDGYNEITVNVPLPANGIYKQTLTDLPSPIATFTGADAPLDSLKASIEGVQDLHGYDHPWPAGGGVNRLDPDSIVQGSTLIPSATNRCSNRGTKTILVSVGDTFTVSRQSTDVRYTMAIRDVVTDEAYSDTGWETSNSFTFTVDHAGYMEIIFSYPDNANITPNEVKVAHFQIEKNSSVTPFTPYSNICPISGWSEANVLNRGKNWLSTNFTEGKGINSSGAVVDNPNRSATVEAIRVIPNTTYTVSYTGSNRWGWIAYDSNGEKIDSASWLNSGSSFTTPVGTYCIRLFTDSGTAPTNLQLELGETASTYEPYNGTTVLIQFGQTVYGGYLNVSTGELTITHVIVDLGTLTWTAQEAQSDYRMRAQVTPIHKVIANNQILDGECEAYGMISANSTYTGVEGLSGDNSGNYIFVYDSNYNTSESASAFTTAMDGVQLVYELATPTTIQLTPTQVRTIQGNNNVFVDCGEVTELKYYSDLP